MMSSYLRKQPGSLLRHKLKLVLAVLLGLCSISVAHAQQASSSYRINAGDILEVFVWGEERLQREARVLPDGTFAFPLAGTIVAQGRTTEQISAEIRSRIQNQFREVVPDVTVSVKDTAGLRIYVVGKVRSPGSFVVGRYINPLQALSLAGGPSEFADVDSALVLSETATGQRAERVRLGDLLKGSRRVDGGSQPQSLAPMKSGDVLVIP